MYACERESVCPLVMCRCVRRRRPLCLSPRRVGGSAAGGGGARVAAGYVSAPGAHRSSGTSLTRSYNAGERAHRTTSGRRARGSTTNARARRARGRDQTSISRRAQRASGSGHGPARTARTAARVYVRSPAAAQTGGGVLLPRARCVVLRGALCMSVNVREMPRAERIARQLQQFAVACSTDQN